MTNAPTTRETADHAELARLAEAATKGEWRAADWDADDGENLWTVEAREPEVLSPGQSSIWPDGVRCKRIAQTEEGENPTEDAAYIAAANPATVLSLLSEIAALRGERDGLIEAAAARNSLLEITERQRDEARDTIASAVAKADWMQGRLSGERSSIDRETIELVVSECRAYCHLQALANQGAE